MKKLYLTAVVANPSEEAQEKIDQAIENQSNFNSVFRDTSGKSREDWEDILSGKVPKSFLEEEKEYLNSKNLIIDEDGYVHLSLDDVDYDFKDYVIFVSEISDVLEADNFGSIITKKDGTEVHVQELVEEVNFYIDYVHMSWLEKQYYKLKSKLINTNK